MGPASLPSPSLLAGSVLLLGCADKDRPPAATPEDTGPPLAAVWRTWHGGEAQDEAGRAVAAGDLDQDGVPEWFVGAPSDGLVSGTGPDRSHSGAYLLAVDAPSGALDDSPPPGSTGGRTATTSGGTSPSPAT